MLNQAETNLHIPQFSFTVNVVGFFFSDFYTKFYFRNIQDGNVSKLVKKVNYVY